jgi:nucleotide-binding universal stress UspA family protein
MPNKVLVAIDRTGLSELVIPALSRVRPEETEILVLQVVEPFIYSVPPEMAPGFAPEMVARQQPVIDEANIELAHAVEVFQSAGFKASSRVVEAEVRQGILEVASEWGANLIVVTSHARTGVEKFFHRSVAEAVVHRAHCSVFVVKEAQATAA